MPDISRLIPFAQAGPGSSEVIHFETFEHGFLIDTSVQVYLRSQLEETAEKQLVIVGMFLCWYRYRLVHYGRDIQQPVEFERVGKYKDGAWNSPVKLFSVEVSGQRFTAALQGQGRKAKAPPVTRTDYIQHGVGWGSWREEKNSLVRARDGKALTRPAVFFPKYLSIAVRNI